MIQITVGARRLHETATPKLSRPVTKKENPMTPRKELNDLYKETKQLSFRT